MNTATVSVDAPLTVAVKASVAPAQCVGRKLRVNKGAVIPKLAPREAVVLADGTKSAIVLGRIALANLDLKRFEK